MAKRYLVTLTKTNGRTCLPSPSREGRRPEGDPGPYPAPRGRWGASDSHGDALHVGTATVERTRKRFVEEGLEAALANVHVLGGNAIRGEAGGLSHRPGL